MKDNKFCISKLTVYLIALFFALVSIVYVTNQFNRQKTTKKTEAASRRKLSPTSKPVKCRTETGYTGFWKKNDICPEGYTEYEKARYTDNYNNEYRCCVPNYISTGKPNFLTFDDLNAAKNAAKQECGNKEDALVEELPNNQCRIYTGEYIISKGEVKCATKLSGDTALCMLAKNYMKKYNAPPVFDLTDSFPNTNAPSPDFVKSTEDMLKILCPFVKDKVVEDTIKVAGNGNRTCLVYTGYYIKGKNIIPLHLTEQDFDNNYFLRDFLLSPLLNLCSRNWRVDYNIGTIHNPSYETENCVQENQYPPSSG